MLDIFDLLREDQIQKDALRLKQGIKIRLRADRKISETRQALSRRSAGHVVADRQRAGARYDAEQARLLQIDAAALRPEPALLQYV